MNDLVQRLQELENRTRKVEGQLRRWRVLACLLAVGALALGFVLPGQAQPPGGPGGGSHTVTAPFVVKGTDGATLLQVTEFVDRSRGNSRDALLTFFRNGKPSAMLRTTGMVYKDAADSKENFLNVLETWLYRYPPEVQGNDPLPFLAASTALTRSGGSLVVFNEQEGPSTSTPPFGARLTAKRGSGGTLVLYNPDGSEAKVIHAH